jgi:hypothetical protein
LWWLDFYDDFRRHLESAYRRIRSDKSGDLYELSRPAFAAMLRPVPERLKRKVNGAAHVEPVMSNRPAPRPASAN